MDITSILAIAVALAVVYFFIKLVVSPLFKAIIGVAVFLIIIYVLQRYFNFNFDSILGPFSKYLDIKNWDVNLNQIIFQIEIYIKRLLSFLNIYSVK